MSKFDVLYLDLCDDILTHGFREKGRNGYTFRIPGRHWVIDLGEEFPILTSKKTAWKSAVREMYWIWKENSIDVRWLQERGIHIWDKFEIDEDGYYTNPDTGEVKFFGEEYAHTIGTSYGYIIANGGEPDKPNQIIEAIRKIKEEPADRRNIVTMWQPPFFGKAVLPPCVYKVQFLVINGKLYLFVEQRSCDTFIGLPFNVPQYAALGLHIAHVCGLKPGQLHYNIVDAHIYEEHVDVVKEMLSRRDEILPAPKVWINPEVKNFFEFEDKNLDDFKLIDYQHLGELKGVVKA